MKSSPGPRFGLFHKKEHVVLLARAGCGLFLLTGCASLKPEPFRLFYSSVQTAQKGLETEMARDVQWTREADVQELANRKRATLSATLMKESTDSRWILVEPPPHWDTRQTLRALEDLNAAFRGYATLLVKAAEGEDLEAFDALADEVNETWRDAENAFSSLTTDKKSDMARKSAIASESLRHYLQRHRRRDLEKALKDNQDLVATYAKQCHALIGVIGVDLKVAYTDQMDALHEKWDDKRSPGRITLTRSLFNLNEELAGALDTLEALGVFYNQLPAAHEDLRRAVAKSKEPRAALTALAFSAERVARLTKDLEKSR